jgi:hypothetical protein
LPAAESRAANASVVPENVVSQAPAVVGKFADSVCPTIVTLPLASSARAFAMSLPLPPISVDHTRVSPPAETLVTNASSTPPANTRE